VILARTGEAMTLRRRISLVWSCRAGLAERRIHSDGLKFGNRKRSKGKSTSPPFWRQLRRLGIAVHTTPIGVNLALAELARTC
jgi:hypothetical protein